MPTEQLSNNRAGLHTADERGASITTASGERFFVFDPQPDDIDMEVVAHALGLLCRYNGHCDRFYSVAEHSVMVSRILYQYYGDARLALIGLLHDAAEAYTGDLVRPIKIAMADAGVDILARADEAITECVFGAHGLLPLRSTDLERVKWADNVALATEKRDLHPNVTDVWEGLPEPSPLSCIGLNPRQATEQFRNEYVELRTNVQVNNRGGD